MKLMDVLDKMDDGSNTSANIAARALHRLAWRHQTLSACAFNTLWRKAGSMEVSDSVMRRVKRIAMHEATGLASIRRRKAQDAQATLFLAARRA